MVTLMSIVRLISTFGSSPTVVRSVNARASVVLASVFAVNAALADPCCVQQNTFTSANGAVAIHSTEGVSDYYFAHEGFHVQSSETTTNTSMGVNSVGFESVIQSDLQIYNVPIYHGMRFSLLGGEEFLNFAVLLPYVINEVGLDDERGLGDVYFGAQYFQGRKGILKKIGAGFKTRTGNFERGLGTDSVDFTVYGRLAKRIRKYTFGMTTAYTFKGSTGDDFLDYGDQVNIKAGADYHYNRDWTFSSDLVFTRQANNTLGVAQFEAAGFLGYDLDFGVRYRLRRNLFMNVDLGFPLREHALDGGSDPERDPVLRLNVSANY